MSFNFGGATSVAAAPASTGFAFGTNSAAAAPASSGFSFGAAPAASSSGGFNFGGATTATSAAPAATSGFNFGGGSTAPAAASSGFNFGGAATAPAAINSFGFGATASSAPSAFSTGGGFGATASSGFSFGGNSSTAAPSAFGTAPAATGAPSFGLFGGNTGAAAAATAPAPSVSAITLETVFEALPADVQKNMGEFHAFLKEQDQSDAFLKSVSPRQLEALQQNLAQLEQDVLARRNVQDKQQTAVHAVRKDVRQLIHQVDTASLSLRSMDGSSANGNAYYSHIMRRVEMPSPYYWDLLEHFEAQMETIKRQIEDVEAQFLLQNNGNNSNSSSQFQFHPAQLQQILMAQNAALMQVAARVAEVHESAEEMRELFLAKMRRDLERHGEKNPAAFKNPFDKRKKSAASDQDKRQAIDSIRFRTNVAPTIVSAAPQQQQAAPSAFGFNASPSFGSTTTAGTTGFGSFGATSAAAPVATATTGGFGFGASSSSSTATTAAPTSTGGFGFGATASTAAPKQVAFNLGAATAASPTGATAASPSFGFGAPAAAPAGGFGSITSSFAPGATSTTSNKRTGRLQKKRS